MTDDLAARMTAEEDQARMGVKALAARVAAYRNELLVLGLTQDEAFVLARDFAQTLAATSLLHRDEDAS